MELDYNQKYFLMSFKFNRTKPEEFGLTQSKYDNDIFINQSDNTQWMKKELYDFGWGNEYGFVRLPELGFLELWNILENSHIEENKYGAAYLLENEYPEDLLEYVLGILSKPNNQINESTKEIFKLLKLNSIINRSRMVGKSFVEINEDYEKWKMVGLKVDDLLK